MSDDAVRVLVVDDDFMVARIHRGFVERMEGFEVAGEARTGAEALARARELQPDIVLLDIYLPDMSGLDVLEQLRSGEFPGLDVVVVTAARDADTVSSSLRFGALHYLIKPFGFDDLHARLRHVAALRSRLDSGADERALAQRDVDQVFGTVSPQGPDRRQLPKGLSEPTMKLVVEHLRAQSAPESATTFGESLGLSRVSARRYLDHLVRIGWVRVDPKYGEVGRPEHHYRWVRD
ncbi:response regulator [Aeromicrobium sp.]|uniref:response regulator n=1 Tax=Aeromicrobium sp. TaxID=1871063 RepID=UPI003D6A579A